MLHFRLHARKHEPANTARSGTRLHGVPGSIKLLVLFAATLALSAIKVPVSAADPTPVGDGSIFASPQETLYLYASGGVVDVTDTLYTANGFTYCVLNGTPIRVILNHEDCHIYGLNDEDLGIIVTSNE